VGSPRRRAWCGLAVDWGAGAALDAGAGRRSRRDMLPRTQSGRRYGRQRADSLPDEAGVGPVDAIHILIVDDQAITRSGLRALRPVAGGGAVVSPGIAQKVLGYLSAPPAEAPAGLFDELTEREREILELIARGKTNAEIATLLNLSAKTVSNYISNVLLKV